MVISHFDILRCGSNDQDFDDELNLLPEAEEEIVSELEEELLTLTKQEVEALLKECMHSYISYENPIARQVITKMWIFVGQPLKRSDQV